MSQDLNDLTPEFHLKVITLLQNCHALNIELVPYFTLRTPQDQAELWRQSRNEVEITQEIARLQTLGASWLAQVLRDAQPRSGPWATNAQPGNSWHQWGEAVDCFWQTDAGAQWHDGPGYVTYAAEAAKLGLTPGRRFSTSDIDHVQLQAQGAPSDLYSWPDIDAKMKQMFGNGG